MNQVADNLAHIHANIRAACDKTGRAAEDVTLIAVTKTFSADRVREAFDAGQRDVGENRLQEAESKIPLLPAALRWHYIGQLQRNKVRKVLPLFAMIHSIDSLRLAQYTNEVARELGLFPQVFLQVNHAGEESKAGFSVDDLRASWEDLMKLDRLEIVGLMSVPPPVDDPEKSRPWFAALRELRDTLARDTQTPLPYLSMGMSSDYAVAIEEGATHVRIGSAVFGTR
jgi:pyridoxal phosphate enzyme (YggS family)